MHDDSEPGYSVDEQLLLLGIARQTLVAVTVGQRRPEIEQSMVPSHLLEPRACFVTLRRDQDLRGCTGTVIACLPLVLEVSASTERTALDDPRFKPVAAEEVPYIRIEISVLSEPQILEYHNAADLPHLLRPHIDGVLLQYGSQRATYLPKVWETITDPEMFLTMLTRKMGLPGESWRTTKLTVSTYHAENFEE